MDQTIKYYSLSESINKLKKQTNTITHPSKYNEKNKLINIILNYNHRPYTYKPMPFEIMSLSELSEQKEQSTIVADQTVIIKDQQQQLYQQLSTEQKLVQQKAKRCMTLLDGQLKIDKEHQIMNMLEIIKSILSGNKERTNQRLKNKLLQPNKSPQQAISFLRQLRKNRII